MLVISNGEKIFSNVNVVVRGQVKSENSSLPVGVHVSETRMLKLPIKFGNHHRFFGKTILLEIMRTISP